VVDVAVPNPVLAEVVLSPQRSFDSLVSGERARARATAFEAASSGLWHEVRLVSVNGDHTLPEIEL